MRVAVSGIAHAFVGTQKLFSDVSLELRHGDMLAVTGSSGSGKSTFLAILAKWLQPLQGSVEFEGVDSIAWVPQNPFGLPYRTALDHVVLPLLARGFTRTEAQELALKTMSRFAIGHLADKEFRALSGGEAQRLMLARATAKDPGLLLVDEPTAQLDTLTAASVNAVLQNLASDKAIVVIATHDEQAVKSCNRQLRLTDYVPRPDGDS